MRALVWIEEGTSEACVRHARAMLSEQTEVTLLHVSPSDVEELAAAGRSGLLGRRHTGPEPALRAISDDEAQDLLAAARSALGRECELIARRGRVEREVVTACADVDVLLLARDGDRRRLGPKNLGPRARFVVDHAPCTVMLIWAQTAPGIDTIPPPPRRPRGP